jgi:adenylate kinase family enzyme
MSNLILMVLGEPCVGKGTLIKAIHEKILDEAPVAILSCGDIVRNLLTDEDRESMKQGGLFPREEPLRDAIYQTVEHMFAFGADVVILDGFPRWNDQLQWMMNNFTYPMQAIRIMAQSDFEIERRAAQRNRDDFDRPPQLWGRVAEQRKRIAEMESMFGMYAIPYSSIINDHIARATAECIDRIKWPHRQKKEKAGKR